MTVVLSQVVFWINKESVPARTVAGICVFPFVIHFIHCIESIVSIRYCNPGGLRKAASRFQSAKDNTKMKPKDKFAYEGQNS